MAQCIKVKKTSEKLEEKKEDPEELATIKMDLGWYNGEKQWTIFCQEKRDDWHPMKLCKKVK